MPSSRTRNRRTSPLEWVGTWVSRHHIRTSSTLSAKLDHRCRPGRRSIVVEALNAEAEDDILPVRPQRGVRARSLNSEREAGGMAAPVVRSFETVHAMNDDQLLSPSRSLGGRQQPAADRLPPGNTLLTAFGTALHRFKDAPGKPTEPARGACIHLSGALYVEVNRLARESGQSIGEIVRLGLGLVRLVLAAGKKGNRLVIASPSGKALEEILI